MQIQMEMQFFRVYDKLDNTEFIEVGMGPKPDNKFWVAVQNT